MKKFILLAIFIAMSCKVCLAEEGNVTLYNDDKDRKGVGQATEIPVINYSDNEVTLTSADFVDAYVVIYSADGEVITEGQMLLSPTKSTITVPDEYSESGCIIEIYYEENSLYGYLN